MGGGLRVTGSEGRTPPRPLFEARLLIISLIPAPPRRLLFAKMKEPGAKFLSRHETQQNARLEKPATSSSVIPRHAHAGFENTHTRAHVGDAVQMLSDPRKSHPISWRQWRGFDGESRETKPR